MTIINETKEGAFVYREIQHPFWWIHPDIDESNNFIKHPIGFFVIDTINTILSSYDPDMWKKFTDKTEEQRLAVYDNLFDGANYLKRMILNTEWLKDRKNHTLNTYEWCQHLGEHFISTLLYPESKDKAKELTQDFIADIRDPSTDNYRFKTLGFDVVTIGNRRVPVEMMYFSNFQMHYLFERDLCYYLFQPNASGVIKQCKHCHMLFYSPKKGNIKYCDACRNAGISKIDPRKKDPIKKLHKNIYNYLGNVLSDDNEKDEFLMESNKYKNAVKAGEMSTDDYLSWLESKDAEYKALHNQSTNN